MTTSYDAILLAGFGGPRTMDDVVPFMRNVTAGKGIPDERLAEVGEHYAMFGGRSPINEQTEALATALRAELGRAGIEIPVVIGNRNWSPYTADALREIVDGGGRRVLTVITAAYTSYSGCRQYVDDIAARAAEVAGTDPAKRLEIDKVRAYFNTPGFIEANVDALVEAYRRSATAGNEDARLVFVTHSVPAWMESGSGKVRPASYQGQHLEVARLVADEAGRRLGRPLEWTLAYCSRSGPPQMPWLEPDISDELTRLAGEGTQAVVVAPIGFISDHMEVIYDLDTLAAQAARELGIGFTRAATAGTHPAFVAALVDVIRERMGLAAPAVAGVLGAWEPECIEGCCPTPTRPAHTKGHAHD